MRRSPRPKKRDVSPRSSRNHTGRPLLTRSSRSLPRCAATREGRAPRRRGGNDRANRSAQTARSRLHSSARCWPRSEAAATRTRSPTPTDCSILPTRHTIRDRIVVDRGSRRCRAPHRPARCTRARVAELEATVGERPGTWMALGLQHAHALLAEPARRGKRFEEALSSDLTRWPFQRARSSSRMASGSDVTAVSPSHARSCVPARHLRRAGMRTVERPGAARATCVRRTEPPPRRRGARSADRARTADRPACG